jgi:hypothetical protein
VKVYLNATTLAVALHLTNARAKMDTVDLTAVLRFVDMNKLLAILLAA